jgi:broad specificity phosphatase PhoE
MLLHEKRIMKLPHMPFYYLRHGETDWNLSNHIMGQQDIPLNERGIQQSQKIKMCLKHIEFEKIWSSPLRRARQTAEIINEEYQYPIFYHDYLKERGWGVDEGLSHEGYFPDMKPNHTSSKGNETKIPEGAEFLKTFERRVITAFQEILVPSSKPPIVVSHGGVFSVLTSLLSDKTVSIQNCELYLFCPPEQSGDLWQVVRTSEPI